MIDLANYVFLLKLIRGVLVAKNKPTQNIVNWLKKSFRWRPVGYGEKTARYLKGLGLKSRLYLKLAFPSRELESFEKILSKNFHENTAEGILLSLLYVEPIIILDDNTSSEIINSESTIINIHTAKKMNTKFIKLHLRIAEYSIKDLFKKLIKETKKKVLSNSHPADFLEYRKRILNKDSKRFWRVNQGSGKIVISYIDPLNTIIHNDKNYLIESLKHNPLSELLLGHTIAIHLTRIIESD